MSGIRKVEKPKGQQPKILGAAPLSDKEPHVLDQHSKGSPVEIQQTPRSPIVPVRSHTRSRPKKEEL